MSVKITLGKLSEPLGTPNWFFLSFWLDRRAVHSRFMKILIWGHFLTRFRLNLARFSEFRLKFAPKMAGKCLKTKIFKKGLSTALDISNICHLAKNLSFLTT